MLRRLLIPLALAALLSAGAVTATAGPSDPDPGAPFRVQIVLNDGSGAQVITVDTVNTLAEAHDALDELIGDIEQKDSDLNKLLVNGTLKQWRVRANG